MLALLILSCMAVAAKASITSSVAPADTLLMDSESTFFRDLSMDESALVDFSTIPSFTWSEASMAFSTVPTEYVTESATLVDSIVPTASATMVYSIVPTEEASATMVYSAVPVASAVNNEVSTLVAPPSGLTDVMAGVSTLLSNSLIDAISASLLSMPASIMGSAAAN